MIQFRIQIINKMLKIIISNQQILIDNNNLLYIHKYITINNDKLIF